MFASRAIELTLCAVLSGAQPTAGLEAKVSALLNREWAQTDRAEAKGMIAWQPTQTPILPGAWPPDGSGVVYAWGWRVEERGSPDHVSSLWGRVRVGGKGELRFERLAQAIEEVGQQARPPTVTKQEWQEWYLLREQVESGILNSTGVAAFERAGARRFYERWAEWDVVTAWLVRHHEPAFFGWLNPTVSKSPPVGPVAPNTGESVAEWRLPEELRIHIWQGIYAHGGGPRTTPWRVQIGLESGRMSVARAAGPGAFAQEKLLLEPDRVLAPAAVKRLRELAKAARAEKPRTAAADGGAAETEVLLLGERLGMYLSAVWLSGPAESMGAAAEALIHEAKKMARIAP